MYPQPNGDGEVSLLHLKRAATDRFSYDKALRHADRRDVSVGGRPPIGTVLPMLFDFLDEVRILK